MSYFEYVLLMIVFIIIIFWFKKDGFYIAGTYLIGSVGYAVAMLLLYTLAFTVDEAPYLASFDRYMVSYLYCGSCLVLMLALDRLCDYVLKEIVLLAILCLFVEPKTLSYLVPNTCVKDDYRMTITVIEQFNNGVDFNREDLNGFRLKFNRLGYLDNSDESYQKLVDAINNDDGLFIIGYDDIIYNFWQKIGIEDYIFNEQYYKVDKENDEVKVTWDAYSFVHYVILYYMMGI